MKASTLRLLVLRYCVSVLLVAVVLSGCVNEAQESVQTGNFTIEFLFEKDGCKMYRFKDGRRYIYWSNCEGKVQADYNTKSGKTKDHVETITSK
jgi:hypothetical protein